MENNHNENELYHHTENATRKADRLSKETGYGAKAMKYSIKSDKVSAKAAKARMKIANNEAYVARMKRKASSVSKEDRAGGYAFVNDFLKG